MANSTTSSPTADKTQKEFLVRSKETPGLKVPTTWAAMQAKGVQNALQAMCK